MIAPLAPFAARGFIWYQGEANAGAGMEYRTLFPRLIQNWRRLWGAELPFIFVQLPACYKDPTPVAEKGWPWLREAQAMTLRESRTSMAVAIDVGDPNNVHPTDKIDVGHRLALLARRDVYGEALVASGPRYRESRITGGKVRVSFSETGGGLVAGQAPWRARGVEPLPTQRLIGFFVAGYDRKWQPADAIVDGDTVIVSSAEVPAPIAVRYGWTNSPRCNLYNREGLPAAPFRTDAWEK
jgi:sialate O-acetylesterase